MDRLIRPTSKQNREDRDFETELRTDEKLDQKLAAAGLSNQSQPPATTAESSIGFQSPNADQALKA
jgi:hypothetical protein